MNNNFILIVDHGKIMKEEDADADVDHEAVVVVEGGKSFWLWILRQPFCLVFFL